MNLCKDDNCEPEKNADEIDLSDDDDDCLKQMNPSSSNENKPKEEPKQEPEPDSDSDSDDGAPQARPFRLPFLPPPTKTGNDGGESSVPKKAEDLREDKPKEGLEEETSEGVITESEGEKKPVKGFKRRNQAIYTKEDDEE